jgi:hypothetical protein
MAVCAEPLTSFHPVLIDHPQGAETHEFGIAVVGE